MGWSPISPTPDTQRNAGVRSKARLLLNMKCICDMESLQFSCNAAMIRQENVPLDVETGVPDSFLIFSLLKKYFHISISLNRTFLPSFFFSSIVFLDCHQFQRISNLYIFYTNLHVHHALVPYSYPDTALTTPSVQFSILGLCKWPDISINSHFPTITNPLKHQLKVHKYPLYH